MPGPTIVRSGGMRVAVLLLAVLALPVDGSADIAPTAYEGISFSPIKSTRVEMRSEEVHITCADSCDVRARFHMYNGTGKPSRIYVGFPIHEHKRKTWKYAFKVNINGKEVKRFTSARSEVSVSGMPMQVTWFGWKHTFAPGDTTVSVQYRIKPSASYYNAHSANIYYVLHTGSFWKGPIGTGSIEIEMSSGLDPDQIFTNSTTPGFTCAGKKVSWTFQNLEPTEKDNIRLEVLPARVFAPIRDLRARLRADPGNQDLKIELARHYFPLGFDKGVTFYLPLKMLPGEYRKTLAKITTDADRDLFAAAYVIGRPCNNCEGLDKELVAKKEQDNRRHHSLPYDLINADPPRYWKLVTVLARADFLPSGERVSKYALRGQALLEEVVHDKPRYAEAWFVYLSNYFRFKFSAYGPCSLCGSPIQERQIEVVERAYRHCPDHKGIALWHDLVNRRKGADKRLQDYNEMHGTYDVPWKSSR